MRNHIVQRLAARRGEGQHPGLLLNRFLAAQNDEGEDKRALIEAARAAGQSEPLRRVYRLAFERWQVGLPGIKATADLATPPFARLIVGLGNKGVIEAGLRLHHTYGVPLVPGSALKGLASHYCAEAWGAADRRYGRKGEFHTLLFGTTEDGGVVRFEDAWMHPDSPGLLKDVMTPHHQKWQTDPATAPTDFDSPVPVPFLSVAGRFHVAVCWQGPDHLQAEAWTRRALALLEEALREWGVGGKTSSGYGRIERPQHGQPVSAAGVKPAARPGPAGRAMNLVEVTLLERMEKSGPNAFRVQEEGRPKGMLVAGTPPSPLPEVGSKVQVYREAGSDPRSPRYRWDVPPPPPSRPSGRRR